MTGVGTDSKAEPPRRNWNESAEERLDRLAWRFVLPHAAASSALALLASGLMSAATGLTWLTVVALLAAVAWLRRKPPVTVASRARLALGWGLAWGAFSLATPATASLYVAPFSVPILMLGGMLFWSQPGLLALHLALVALPACWQSLAAGSWRMAAMTAATAVLVWVAARGARALLLRGTGSHVSGFDEQATADETARVMEATGDACFVVDADGRIECLNQAARELSAAGPGVRFRDALPLVDPGSGGRARDPVAACLRQNGATPVFDCTALVPGPERQRNVSIRTAALQAQRVLVAVIDRTEVRTLERLQLLQSARDPLTGLANRVQLERRYRALREDARGAEHALCCLKIEQVALVNEACGHTAGDALLRHVALQLVAAARGEDCVARLHGGQFALLLPGCSNDAARGMAEKLLGGIDEAGFKWGGQRFRLSAHIGVAPFRSGRLPFADVLGAAGAACRVAGENDKEPVHLYHETDAALQRHASLRDWMQRVQQAVENDRFELLAHDIVPVRNAGAQRHAELLVRLRDASDGLVSPALFLGAAERLQLMPAIDRWVVREAFSLMTSPDGPLADYGFCAINLSGQSLSDDDMCGHIEECLGKSGLEPQRVCFEITETAAITDLPAAVRLMKRLRERGCCFALDDFGTGFSSYAYLKQLPAQWLKIDGAFVRGMAVDGTDRAVVESINQVAHMAGMQTIAEYVRDAETLAALEQVGVDYAQGSLFGEPRTLS